MKPFVFKFRQSCNSKFQPNNQYVFDDEIDMVVKADSIKKIPVVFEKNSKSLGTKKADLEKGEDQKDNFMWNN